MKLDVQNPTHPRPIDSPSDYNHFHGTEEQHQLFLLVIDDFVQALLHKYHSLKDNETEWKPIYLVIEPYDNFDIIGGMILYPSELRPEKDKEKDGDRNDLS
jgi:hypothetical protein